MSLSTHKPEMSVFTSSRDAKEFLVQKVIAEAARENVSLTEIEKKMLYFSEMYPSLPDINEVSAKFDKEYDMDAYEAKITKLFKNAFQRDRKESPELASQWTDAIGTLAREDHYISVMVGEVAGNTSMVGETGGDIRTLGDVFRLIGTAIAVIMAFSLLWFAWEWFANRFSGAVQLAFLAFCVILIWFAGKIMADRRFIEWTVRWFRPKSR